MPDMLVFLTLETPELIQRGVFNTIRCHIRKPPYICDNKGDPDEVFIMAT